MAADRARSMFGFRSPVDSEERVKATNTKMVDVVLRLFSHWLILGVRFVYSL